jgi:hypothetical protein
MRCPLCGNVDRCPSRWCNPPALFTAAEINWSVGGDPEMERRVEVAMQDARERREQERHATPTN